MIVEVIIPALNEENAVAKVIDEISRDLIRDIIVVDNGSSDNTPQVAQQAGAIVCHETRKGYGYACLKGMDYIANHHKKLPDVIIFIDGDRSDFPIHIKEMLDQIIDLNADMVIGSRVLGTAEAGSLTPVQKFGNWLATYLIRKLYNVHYTDLGPFRAIKYSKLMEMQMTDKTYGWTVEMQVKAAKLNMKSVEIPVNYRNRIGISKVSGTIKGSVLAGYKIITTIFKYL